MKQICIILVDFLTKELRSKYLKNGLLSSFGLQRMWEFVTTGI